MTRGKKGFYNKLEEETRKNQFLTIELSQNQRAFLDAKEEEIISNFAQIRRKIDYEAHAFFKNILENKDTKTLLSAEDIEARLEKYPVGYCRHIVTKGINEFNRTNNFNSFHEQGIKLKRIYGIQDGELYNSIQIGDKVLSITDDKNLFHNHNISLVNYEESTFHTITDLEELTEIIKVYWGVEVFNTATIPDLTSTHPFVLKDSEGKLFFDGLYDRHLYFDETQNDFAQVQDFVNNSKALSIKDTETLDAKLRWARIVNSRNGGTTINKPSETYNEKEGRKIFSELLDQRLDSKDKEFLDQVSYARHEAVNIYLTRQ